jgi:hypothetical protein
MIYCTYFTEGFYEEVAKQYIIPSFLKLGIVLHQVKVPSTHDWKKNTAMKAQIILDCIEKFEADIVMIDADATLEQYPTLFEQIDKSYDIAVHYLDVDKFWHDKEGSSKRQLCSGTVMFRNSQRSKELLITWIEENKKYPQVLEQQNLQNVLNRNYHQAYPLPIEYCAIVKRDGTCPSYIKNIIIKHNQISRVSKNKC